MCSNSVVGRIAQVMRNILKYTEIYRSDHPHLSLFINKNSKQNCCGDVYLISHPDIHFHGTGLGNIAIKVPYQRSQNFMVGNGGMLWLCVYQ